MPFYDLKCSDCEKTFTVKTSFSNLSKEICPKCGSKKVKQQFSAFGINKSKNSCSTTSCSSFS